MKNVTITVDDKAAAWARKQAAEHGVSLSRYVGALLEQTMRRSREYERAMRDYLAREPAALSGQGARYPTRDDVHERRLLR